jgi:predicted nucleotidyltransferase
MTRYGPLDVLGAIGKGHGYDELISHSIELDVGESLKVRLLTLEKHIQIKEEVARDQDKAVLPILHRTLEEQSKT